MDNLLIVAALLSPVAGDMSLPIDGILLSLACRRAYGPPPPLLPGERLPFDPAVCPLEIVHEGNDWFYAASFAMWNQYVEQPTYWNKRLDMQHAEALTDAKSINTAEGHYRGYHYRMQTRHASMVRWHVRGDKAVISELLEDATHIGKKPSMGYGEVASWSVSKVEPDWSIIGPEGFVTRAVPHSWAMQAGLPINSQVGRRAIRPPYWDVQNLRLAYVPGRTF